MAVWSVSKRSGQRTTLCGYWPYWTTKSGDLSAARQNLDRILSDPEATVAERAEAFLVRSDVRRSAGDLDGGISDLASVLAMNDGDLDDQKQMAGADLPGLLLTRSILRSGAADFEAAMNDLNHALGLVSRVASIRSMLLVNRSVLHMRARRLELADKRLLGRDRST